MSGCDGITTGGQYCRLTAQFVSLGILLLRKIICKSINDNSLNWTVLKCKIL